MNKKVSVNLVIMLVCAAVLLTYMMTYVSINNKYNQKINANLGKSDFYGKLSVVDKLVRDIYLGDIDEEELTDSIIRGYVEGIGDKYANYLNREQYAGFTSENSGKMVGIGVKVEYDNVKGVIEVISVMAESPAEKAGVFPGDLIYKVGEEYVKDLGYLPSVEKIKGEEGTQITITVLRGTDTYEEISYTLTRAEVVYDTVSYRLINGNIGYIRINEFNRETGNEFAAAVETLEKDGADRFIFDVRYNPGGDLVGIEATLDYILPPGGPIIRVVYKDGHEDIREAKDSHYMDAPMVVLINRHTASAAELFSAALRDYEIATLIGETTYGKGTMQTITRLSDGSGVSISQYMYNPPYGDNYEGMGVSPDIEASLPEDKSFNKLTDEEDTQLQKAIEIINNK